MYLKKLLTGMLAFAALASCQKQSYYMTLSEKESTVAVEGGTVQLTLTTNTYVRVNNDMSEWVKISNSAVVGDATQMILEVQPNPNLEERVGTIRFIGDFVTPLKYTLTQKPVVPVGVDPAEISALRKDTSAKFKVLGDKPWTLTCDNAAFVPNVTSGTGETTVTVTFPTNETEEEAVANITVKIGEETYTVKITQAGYPKKVYEDLSATATSNCYIVSKVGYFKFKATVRGNGTVPASFNGEISSAIEPKGAKVLWCTYNTATAPASVDEIITDVSVVDGYVRFKMTNDDAIVNANTVIAAYPDEKCEGDILWSWHIWSSADVPSTSNIGGKDWMDRNLGATCANIIDDAGSCGLFYQFGRKDPFRSASTFTDGDFILTCPAPVAGKEDVVMNDVAGTMEATIKNPRAFVQCISSTYKDWLYTADHKDRWNDGEKTMFDPCPVGYRVPTSANIIEFGIAGGFVGQPVSEKGEPYKNAYKKDGHYALMTDIWTLPLAGLLNYNDGSKIGDYGAVVRVLTSTYHASTKMTSMYLNCNGSACNFGNAATAGHAASVRCVKE